MSDKPERKQRVAYRITQHSASQIIRDYMERCEAEGVRLAGSTDPLEERLYWRADGAADALEHVLGLIEAQGVN